MNILIILILPFLVFIAFKLMKLVLKSDTNNVFIKYLDTKNDKKSMQSIIKDKIDKNNFINTEAIDIDNSNPVSIKSKETSVLRRLLISKSVDYNEKKTLKSSIKRMILSIQRRTSNNKLLTMKIKLKSLSLANKKLFTFLFKSNKKDKSLNNDFNISR